MEGVYIGKSRGGGWALLSATLVAVSLAAMIFLGPFCVYGVSGIGVLAGLIGLILASRTASLERPTIFPSILAGVHIVLFAVAGILQMMFLTPLGPAARKIPILQTPYTDPSGVFTFKGP